MQFLLQTNLQIFPCTIRNRINDIFDNTNTQLINKLKNKHFAIQFDEATDCNKDIHLICYFCLIEGVNVTKDLLFFKSIFKDTKDKDLCKIINNIMNNNNIK